MKTNRYFVFVLVLYLALTIVLSVKVRNTQHESFICLNKGRSKKCAGKPQIKCNNQQMIRIENIEYYKGSGTRDSCNSGCKGDKHAWNIQQDEHRKIQSIIYQRCSYHQTCELSTLSYTPAGLKGAIWFIHVNHTCISEDDVINFCSPLERNITEELHLVTNKTQAYDTCSCIISENANITITEYTPCYDGLCTDNAVFMNEKRTFPCSPSCVDTIFSNFQNTTIDTQTNITVTGVNPKMFFWLSVSNTGQGMSTIVCNGPGSIVSVPTPTTDDLQHSTTDRTTSNKTNKDGAPFPTEAVVGGVVGSVVAIAVIVVVLIKCIRRQTTTKQSSDDDPH